VHAELRDVSLADASSVLVAASDVAATGDGPSVAVADLDVDRDAVPSGAQLGVRVHCDVSGDRSVAVGDWVTTQSYPVDLRPNDEERELTVLVRPVD
jgi:uncharacterized lipoprotein YbaY